MSISAPVDTRTEFDYVTYIRTTPEELWRALTDPDQLAQYWGVRLHSDWTPGATMVWEEMGTTIIDPEQVVLVADPPNHLEYTWHTVTREFITALGGTEEEFSTMSAEDRSRIQFGIEPVGDSVKLTLRHTGFAPGSAMLAGVTDGWPTIVASLKSLLETGEPLKLD